MSTFGQDFKAANRLTAAQVDALDTITSIGFYNGRIEGESVPGDWAELGRVYASINPRTLASLKRRGLIDERGITDHGYDVLSAHI